MTSTLALLDGDIIAYVNAAAAQEEFDGEVQSDTQGAIENALAQVEVWTRLARCDTPVVCFSDPEGRNFRKTLGPYKASRPDKPLGYWEVVAEIEKYFRVERIPSLEGDDVMGIMSTSPKLKNRTVIVSTDKDMQTIPGTLLNPDKDRKPRVITPEFAHRYWMMQTLTGDPTDEYGGCPNVGEVKAKVILDSPHNLVRNVRTITKGKNKGKQEVKWTKGGPTDLWSSICAYYRKAGQGEDHAILQARMARILHRNDYNKEEGLIYLWHPNSRRRQVLPLPAPTST